MNFLLKNPVYPANPCKKRTPGIRDAKQCDIDRQFRLGLCRSQSSRESLTLPFHTCSMETRKIVCLIGIGSHTIGLKKFIQDAQDRQDEFPIEESCISCQSL